MPIGANWLLLVRGGCAEANIGKPLVANWLLPVGIVPNVIDDASRL